MWRRKQEERKVQRERQQTGLVHAFYSLCIKFILIVLNNLLNMLYNLIYRCICFLGLKPNHFLIVSGENH